MKNEEIVEILNKVLFELKRIDKELDDWDLYDPDDTHWCNIETIIWDLGQYLENILEELMNESRGQNNNEN